MLTFAETNVGVKALAVNVRADKDGLTVVVDVTTSVTVSVKVPLYGVAVLGCVTVSVVVKLFGLSVRVLVSLTHNERVSEMLSRRLLLAFNLTESERARVMLFVTSSVSTSVCVPDGVSWLAVNEDVLLRLRISVIETVNERLIKVELLSAESESDDDFGFGRGVTLPIVGDPAVLLIVMRSV